MISTSSGTANIFKVLTRSLLIQHRMINDTSAGSAIGNCVPCHSLNNNNLIPIENVKGLVLQTIPLWNLSERNHDTNVCKLLFNEIKNTHNSNYYSIYRKFTTKNFQSALDCINDIGRLAEEQNHHPNLSITNYREVTIEIYTHKLNGITENDIQLAHRIDMNVSIEYSPKWLKLHPEASGTSKSL
jgi:pterin-4a-carbinolamine dehydratase